MSKTYDQAEKAMRDLLDASNKMGSTDDVAQAIANVLIKEHRTLQQAFFRSFKQAMDGYSKSGSDLRNEGSIELAKVINTADVYLPYV